LLAEACIDELNVSEENEEEVFEAVLDWIPDE